MKAKEDPLKKIKYKCNSQQTQFYKSLQTSLRQNRFKLLKQNKRKKMKTKDFHINKINKKR